MENGMERGIFTMIFSMAGTLVFGLVVLGLWGCPKYHVYTQTMEGTAALKKAEQDRNIKILEATAAKESAKHLAQAEVERARGVAEANKIIGDSLKGNTEYLKYLWIHNLEAGSNSTIYIPTEAGLPILEAGKRK